VERAPELRRIPVDGAVLACFDWPAAARSNSSSDGAPVLFAHATGYHARVWDVIVRALPSRRVVAVDMRGHGRSDRTPVVHWKVFGEDLAALVRALDLRGVVGVGHSMGGHALVDAAARCPERFARLALFDPVIASPEEYGEGAALAARAGDTPHPTARRKSRFASPDEMFERFRARSPYAAFDPRTLRDYCEHGLLPAADGDGYELACPPELEASIYRTARTNGGVLDSVRALALPVTVVRAKRPPPVRDPMDFSCSPTWPGLAAAFADGLDVHLAERTHFFPLESPELAAAFVVARDPRAGLAAGGPALD
jgi:pimeloyl-ACP methyl ester carboxylesterase